MVLNTVWCITLADYPFCSTFAHHVLNNEKVVRERVLSISVLRPIPTVLFNVDHSAAHKRLYIESSIVLCAALRLPWYTAF